MNNDLWVITTYYNPCNWKTRRDNYDLFIHGLDAVKVKHLTVECAFGNESFQLPKNNNIIQIRSNSVLWQKEKLLNIAAALLPSNCKYVAWLDCDIIFDNMNWVKELKDVLKVKKVAQVFSVANKLNKYGKHTGDISASFGCVMCADRSLLNTGRYDTHGHTGYGWAMHKEIFDKVGLYEHAISGSADHFMAHAIYGDYNFCIINALKNDEAQIQHLIEWGLKFSKMVNGSLGFVPGVIHHLWHGETKDRRYFKRMHDITDLGYNPYTDIISLPYKPLEWNTDNQPLKDYFKEYFQSRKED